MEEKTDKNDVLSVKWRVGSREEYLEANLRDRGHGVVK